MGDFEFQVVGEVVGQWDGSGPVDWILPDGELFFFCSWRIGQQKLTWFGIYHEALDHLEAFARRSGRRVHQLIRSPHEWYRLEELSTETPGWGLVYEPAPGALKIFRDSIGRLPLVWMRSDSGLEWGTLASYLPSFRARPCESRIDQYLRNQRCSGTSDFWQGVHRIRAGESLTAAKGLSNRIKIRLETWWPILGPNSPKNINISQRVGDFLIKEINSVVQKNQHCSVSLSGGVDSSLLFALAASQGAEPVGYSMVDPRAEKFDESQTIRRLHRSLGTTGNFYCIGGAQRWRQIQDQQLYPDFGPLFHPEVAYQVPFLKFVKKGMDSQAYPPVLIAGVGADQIFGCRRLDLKLWRTRSRDVGVALRGLRALPAKYKIKTALQVSGLNRIAVRPVRLSGLSETDTIRSLDLKKVTFFSREEWRNQRANQFREWSWEHTVRLLEIYRRSTGVLYQLPYLTPKLCRFSFGLEPDQLRDPKFTKRVLRKLLRGRVPDSISARGKFGVFGDVVRSGLVEYFDGKRFIARQERASLASTQFRQFINARETLSERKFQRRCERANWDLWRLISTQLWLEQDD